MPYIVSLGAGEKGRVVLEQWKNRGGHRADDGAEHLADAAVVLLDVNGLGGTLAQLAPSLAGKIVIDCSNLSSNDDLRSRPCVAQEIARSCPDARVVKALNSIDTDALNFEVRLSGTSIDGTYTSGYYCGDDAQAKQVVAGLLGELALEPIDCGPLANAVLLESLGLLAQYLKANVYTRPFAIVVARQGAERSPLDRWM